MALALNNRTYAPKMTIIEGDDAVYLIAQQAIPIWAYLLAGTLWVLIAGLVITLIALSLSTATKLQNTATGITIGCYLLVNTTPLLTYLALSGRWSYLKNECYGIYTKCGSPQ